MSFCRKFSRLFAAACIATSLGAGPSFADLQQCSCRNLESLQQELENALYEAKFFADMAEQLKQREDELTEAKKDPTNPDSGLDVFMTSSNLRQAIMNGFSLPHLPAKDYTGPATVNMTYGSCEQPQSQLDAMRDGSQCKDIADITLRHEELHRALCNSMGATAYWDRMPSAIAVEEAERYRQQADEMRAALKLVIDMGTMTVEARMEPRIAGPQFDVTYSYVTASTELGGKSSPGSDTWTLNGKGNQAGKIKQARLAGMTCTSSGQLNDDVDFVMQTDGLSMSLDSTSKGKPGDLYLRCKKGFGMSMRPKGETGQGQIFSSLPMRLETEYSLDVKTMPFAQVIAQGGMSVSGSYVAKVKLICPGD
jgi:hypothetical protein